jgi:hypothetical protein
VVRLEEKSKGKKLMVVRADLAEKIAELSRKEGKTIFALTNEMLESAMEAYEMGLEPSDMVNYYLFTSAEKESGTVSISPDALLYMVKKLYPKDKRGLWKRWREWGRWYGKYLMAKFYDQEPLETFRKFLASGVWHISDFNFSKEGDHFSVRCLMPRLSSEITELFLRFLEGLIDSFGYTVTGESSSRGIISLRFKKKQRDERT